MTRARLSPVPLRRLRAWGLCLLAAVSLTGFTGDSGPEARAPQQAAPPAISRKELDERVQRAATAAAERNLATARSELAFVLEHSPDNPQALYVLACVELEAGRHEEATQAVTRLERAEPGLPETAMLRDLITTRREHPELGWRKAFLQVWRKHGSPDFKKNHVLPVDMQQMLTFKVDEELWSRAADSVEARVVLLLLEVPKAGSERWKWLVGQLPKLKDPVLSIMAIEALRSRTPAEPLRAQVEEVARQSLARLVKAHPRDMHLRLMVALGSSQPETPFTSREIAALETAAGYPDWRLRSFHQVYQQVLARLETLGMSNPPVGAFVTAIGYAGGGIPSLLLQRAQASREKLSHGELKRLCGVLERVGVRMSEQTTLIEHLIGINLMATSAEWMGDTLKLQHAEAMRARAFRLMNDSQRLGHGRWPLRSLEDEMIDAGVRNELLHLSDFSLEPPADWTP